MQAKSCHRAINARPGLFGLGVFDLLVLAACFIAWTHFFGRPLRALAGATALTMGLRYLRAGRLPGLPRALCGYFWYSAAMEALGSEPLVPTGLEMEHDPGR